MKTPEKLTGEFERIKGKLSDSQLTFHHLLNNAREWLPKLESPKQLWRVFIPALLSLQMAACKPSNFENYPSPPPITSPLPSPTLPPTSEPTATFEPIATSTPGPTISGETLAIGGAELELKVFDGGEIANLIGAQENGWQVITNEKGGVSFFSGYAGEKGKETQVVVLAQGPKGYTWEANNQLWQNGNQVVIPDILLPGGWDEEKQMAGPAHEADVVFLFQDETGNYRVGVIYNPDKVAQIPDKSNLRILPDGSGLYVGNLKNIELGPNQQAIRDKEGNLRLNNPDGSYFLMKTSWPQVKSPEELYQAGTFAGPFEEQPNLPYPADEIAQQLEINNYQLIKDNNNNKHYVAIRKVIDEQTGEDHSLIVAQATFNKQEEFTGWQRTLPFDVETGLVVAHPQETNPELFNLKNSDAPIPQFVNAMRMGGIEVDPQQVVDNLQYQTITGADGKPYVIASFNLDPNPNKKDETLEGPIPLMIAQKNKNGEWGWKRCYLKDIANIKEITIRALSGFGAEPEEEKFREIALRNFNAITISYDWENLEPTQAAYNPEWPDYQYDKAVEAKIQKYTLHHLLPSHDDMIPDWVDRNMNTDQAKKLIEDHIVWLINHYKKKNGGRLDDWVLIVVNEAMLPEERGVRDFFADKIGPEYIDFAFEIARREAPEAILIYNDSNNHGSQGITSQDGITTFLTLEIAQRLSKKGLIDGVGLEMHLSEGKLPNIKDLIKTIKTYQSLGVSVYVTEFDVNLTNVGGSQKERFLYQANIVQQVIRGLLRAGVKDIGVWDIGDSRARIDQPNADPTLFDDYGSPKPSYYAYLLELNLSNN